MESVDETRVTVDFFWPDDLSRFLVLASCPWNRKAFANVNELPGIEEMLDLHLSPETIRDFDIDSAEPLVRWRSICRTCDPL